MKRLIFTFVSAAAVCAFVSATPTLAATSTDSAAVVAAPFDAVGSILSAPFAPAAQAYAPAPSQAAQTQSRCRVIQDSYGADGRYTSVCDF